MQFLWQCILFLWLFSILVVEKCDFLKVVKIPYPKNRFLVILRSFSQRIIFSQSAGGGSIRVTMFKEVSFIEKKSSLVGLKKSDSIFCKSADFGPSRLPRSTFKVVFLNVQAKFQKIFGQFPGKGCKEHCGKP